MTKSLIITIVMTFLLGTAAAQQYVLETKPNGRIGRHIIDLSDVHQQGGSLAWQIDLTEGNLEPAGSRMRHGPSLWNNMAISGWFTGIEQGYLHLDWGKLQPTSSGLPDEVIDGFTFTYGSNNMDPAGESFAIYYHDSCTGWGKLGVVEAGFVFTGLPNGYGFPTLPPGYGWTMSVTVDLDGSGYEFLLNQDLGQCYVPLNTPTMGATGVCVGKKPDTFGNGPTGTEHAFDLYYPNGTYSGTWWGCSGMEYWFTWPGELFGPGGAAFGMTYYGIGAAGNTAGLYTAGSWTAGDDVLFLLRKNESPLSGWLLASLGELNQYIPTLGVTRLVGQPAGGTPFPMTASLDGDFCTFDLTVPAGAGSLSVYFQGILGDPPLQQPPIDLSNGARAN